MFICTLVIVYLYRNKEHIFCTNHITTYIICSPTMTVYTNSTTNGDTTTTYILIGGIVTLP